MAIDTHSLLSSKCVHTVQRTRRCCGRIACYSVLLLLLCDDGLMMAPKMLRLRSSSQMREVNTHGAAGGGVWLRPSVLREGYRYSVLSGVSRQDQKLKIWRESRLGV